MENSKELKPCPCCGGKAEQGTTSLADTYSDYEQIECTVCGLAIPLVIDGDMKGGIKRWNTRHDDAAIRKERADEIERLRAWQQEAVRWLEGARTIMDVVGAPKDMKDNLDRLIAEAQEDYVDGHKQC